eukprot:m.1624505 g.1624505  ORF g.1624505 m.1624505 type:complete len:535 (-) comp25389_c0_seq6:4984-6588(-)
MHLFTVLCLTLLAAVIKPAQSIGDPMVSTKYGDISGTFEGNVAVFRGIPFAAPPVGKFRWRPPQPVQPWKPAVLNASIYGSKCMQVSGNGSEDCLYLNVYVFGSSPQADPRLPQSQLPVLFFIHGGGYQIGSSNDYNGTELTAFLHGKAIIVTTNYRLNAFGFLGGNMLRRLDPDGSTGNYGIQDQRAALQWVQENIDAFQGDKTRVMIFGESAGAGSVSNHLVMPKSNRLFDTAAIESGSFALWAAQPMNYSEIIFEQILNYSKCDSVGCLQAIQPADVVRAVNSIPIGLCCDNLAQNPWIPWAPTVDGVELEDHPRTLLQKHKVNTVRAVLQGTNLDEGASFDTLPPNVSMQQLTTAWNRWYEDVLGRDVSAQLGNVYLNDSIVYPIISGTTRAWWAAQRALTDIAFGCPARTTSTYLTAVGVDVYQYQFVHAPSTRPIVFHGAECKYVFLNYIGMNSEEVTLAQYMAMAWYRVAADGFPGPMPWTRYTNYPNAEGPYTILDVQSNGWVRTGHSYDVAGCTIFQPWLESFLR